MPPSLTDSDPDQRAAALRAIRYRDLKDPAVLEAVLKAARDRTPAGAGSAADPFAAFFGGDNAPAGTIAEIAAERIGQTGFPPDDGSLSLLARILAEGDDPGTLPQIAARALAETRWPEPEAAVRALVPAISDRDQPLFEAIVALPAAVTPALAEIAADPVRPRLFQELLNHPPSRPAVVAAVERSATERPPDDATLAMILGVLAGWGEPAAARVAHTAAPRAPWAVAWAAVVDEGSGEALQRFIADGAPGAPADLWPRTAEVLRQRGLPDGFPLGAWLTASGDLHGLCEPADLEREGVAEVLGAWVAALAEGDRPDRGWRAAALLATAGRHGPVLAPLQQALARGGVSWDEAILAPLAAATPRIPGLSDALIAHPQIGDPGPAVEAISALGPEAIRAFVDRVIRAAEAAPRRCEPVGPDTVREAPAEVDVEAISSLVEALGDGPLQQRYDAVAPVVRAEDPR